LPAAGLTGIESEARERLRLPSDHVNQSLTTAKRSFDMMLWPSEKAVKDVGGKRGRVLALPGIATIDSESNDGSIPVVATQHCEQESELDHWLGSEQ